MNSLFIYLSTLLILFTHLLTLNLFNYFEVMISPNIKKIILSFFSRSFAERKNQKR